MKQAASGISDLIARIKADGIQAGEDERKERIEAASREAAKIVADARAEAERIVGAANAEAERRRHQLDAELRMAARDFVLRLQERLSAQVLRPVTADLARAALADDGAVTALILDLLRERAGGARLTLDADRRAALEAAVIAGFAGRLGDGGLEITDEAGLGGFRLARDGENFVWDASADAVARELASLVEPSLRAALTPKSTPG